MEKQRLDKFLSSQTRLSRSEARTAIKRGRVTVNTEIVRDFGQAITPQTDNIAFEGQNILYRKYMYILMNKPKGVLCASNDKSRETVVDLVPENLKRNGLFPVGRLDRDTTGMLMITDDGDFAHRIISPKSLISKSYIATLDGKVTPEMAERFKAGVTLADGTLCRPAILEALGENIARLVLCEGKYHEVKRMFGTVGLGVNELHRESIGDLCLPDGIAEGECVEMTEIWLELVQKSTRYAF